MDNKLIKTTIIIFGLIILLVCFMPMNECKASDGDITKVGSCSNGDIYVDSETSVEYLAFNGGSYGSLVPKSVVVRVDQNGRPYLYKGN